MLCRERKRPTLVMHSACVSVRASAHHRGAVQDLGLRQVLLQLQHGLAGLRGLPCTQQPCSCCTRQHPLICTAHGCFAGTPFVGMRFLALWHSCRTMHTLSAAGLHGQTPALAVTSVCLGMHKLTSCLHCAGGGAGRTLHCAGGGAGRTSKTMSGSPSPPRSHSTICFSRVPGTSGLAPASSSLAMAARLVSCTSSSFSKAWPPAAPAARYLFLCNHLRAPACKVAVLQHGSTKCQGSGCSQNTRFTLSCQRGVVHVSCSLAYRFTSKADGGLTIALGYQTALRC